MNHLDDSYHRSSDKFPFYCPDLPREGSIYERKDDKSSYSVEQGNGYVAVLEYREKNVFCIHVFSQKTIQQLENELIERGYRAHC
jgi:hypothetical protein